MTKPYVSNSIWYILYSSTITLHTMVVNCGRRERLGSRRDIYGHIEVCFYIVAGRNMNSLMVSVRTETLCRYIPTAPLSLYAIVVMIIVIYLAS